jgi:multiple sugar transport system permease protein
VKNSTGLRGRVHGRAEAVDGSVARAARWGKPGLARSSRTWRRMRTASVVAAMAGPTLVLVGLFVVGPAVYGIWLSFTNKSLEGATALHTQFVGLANYRTLFTDGGFLQSLGISAEFVFFSAIVGQFVLGMIAAILLSRTSIRFKGLFGAAILLPMVVPEVVAALAWGSMLAEGQFGTLNRGLALLGISPVDWLQSAPLLSIIIINIWRGIAFAMIMFQAAIESIPKEIEQAARVDGASPWQIVRHITLPMIRGPIQLYMLVSTITTFSIFGLVYFLTQGGPGTATNLVAIYIYNYAFQFFEIGLGSAGSVIVLLATLVLGFIYVRLSRAEVLRRWRAWPSGIRSGSPGIKPSAPARDLRRDGLGSWRGTLPRTWCSPYWRCSALSRSPGSCLALSTRTPASICARRTGLFTISSSSSPNQARRSC